MERIFNVLLDELPTEWNGHPIDTNFRTGIQISKVLADKELTTVESFYTATYLLFPDTVPNDVEEIKEALKWYMTEYNHDNNVEKEKSNAVIFDYDVDQWRVYAAFREQYGIDLYTTDMHWFVFMGLLSNLKDCTLTRVMNTRARKITKNMSPAERRALEKAKAMFMIRPDKNEPITPEEQKRLDEFMKYANLNKKPTGA